MSKKTLISRLSLAALALPGLMQQAEAGRAEESYNTDLLYGHYEETGGRMKVDIAEISASLPIGKAYTLSLDFVSDTMSGASPMFNMKNAQGQVEQVLSGASITEQRYAGTASLSYAFEDVTVSLGGGVSSENDYLSNYINTGLSWDLNNKLTTLNVSASVAFDEVSPTGYNYTKNKIGQQYLLGVTQIIDKNSLLQSNMTFGYNSGYLSDPYKLVFVQGAGIQSDNRPEQKFQWAWLTRYVRNFDSLNKAALHADYRLYVDDWGVTANMVELSWQQPIADEWQIMPRFRYYTQDQADFYSAVFDSATVGSIHSSDYRLAGFGVLGGGIKLSKNFEVNGLIKDVKLQTAFDYYDRKASYQIGGHNDGSFADYGFYMVTASINVKF
ncbi:MAG: DUF3570 domain-containing protein [Methylococcaceae bacterium]|nr:DUF3570 domain-containing protein [Methylococcaceae bacterium]